MAEKRCYTVKDLQEMLDVSRSEYSAEKEQKK